MPNSIICLFFCLGALFSCQGIQAQEKPSEQIPLLLSMLEKFHYSPVELNEVTSAEVFHDFIKNLDPHGRFFLASDLDALESCQSKLFESNTNVSFLTKISKIYAIRLQAADSLIGTLLQNPIDFSTYDCITYGHNPMEGFATSETELKQRWVKIMKHKTLEIMFQALNEENAAMLDAETLMAREPGARMKAGTQEKKTIQKTLKHPSGFENRMAELFLNTVANRFDPHTLYLNADNEDQFRTSMSRETRSFGIAGYEENNGEVAISKLAPGGSAWKSGQLHQGDILVSVKWPDGKVTDFAGFDEMEIAVAINKSEYDGMLLTVRKNNGLLTTVSLHKEMTRVDENNFSGYLLSGEKKIGYIALPGFYSEWGSQDPLGCANDVAKEILKLREEQIEGLVLDLRNNGGGSLLEAVGMMGLFVDEGPLFMMKEKNQKPNLVKDPNRGTAYTGPLLVLVNGMSASASELFACVMRDYNRAIIAGSNTFGKAVSQMMIPLDTSLNKVKRTPDHLSSAWLNITISKLYRINGASYQRTGVAPDISLPDIFDNRDFGEASEPYALKPDTVDKKVWFKPYPALPIEALKEKQMQHNENLAGFKRIKGVADSLHLAFGQKKEVPLSLEEFRIYKEKHARLRIRLEQLIKVSNNIFAVSPNLYDDALNKADASRQQTNEILINNIGRDIYIQEAYLIMKDYINIKNN